MALSFLACILCAIVLGAVLPVNCSVQKRDADPVRRAVLDSQAQRIETLEAKVSSLEGFVSQLQVNARTQVTFAAHMSNTGSVSLSTSSPIVFDAVTTNVGNGYNPGTGVFTVPVSGTYLLYLQIMDDRSSESLHVAITKNGATLAMTTAEGYSNVFDKGSCMVAAHLQRGERVYVRHVQGGTAVIGYWFTAFAGALIKPDLA